MKIAMLAIMAALFMSSASAVREYQPSSFDPVALPFHAPVQFMPGIYEKAVQGTSVCPDLLRAIALAESDEMDCAMGDAGSSLGRMQINEDFREMRIEKYGYYNPHNPEDATRLAALILADHYRTFGNWRLAVSAYNQGAGGTRMRGERAEYLQRVEEKLGRGI